jgi:hypothetical protein
MVRNESIVIYEIKGYHHIEKMISLSKFIKLKDS